jgi:divalent metal cation (Fe/Co/Zn/Cd) transporter
LERLRNEGGFDCQPHQITLRRIGRELSLTFHCTVDAQTSLAAAHALTERIEGDLRREIADLGRVVIHVEPPEKGSG